MNADIYYFSGTGNSLYIARAIAQKIDGRAIPIGQFMDMDTITADADITGIVFPVYYGEVPVMIKKFASRLKYTGSKYVFAVCNYGGAAARSLKILKNILGNQGIGLSSGFGIHMPQNAFKKPWEDVDKIYSGAEKRLDFIARKVEERAKGTFYTNIPLEIFIKLMHPLVRKLSRKDFLKRTGAPEQLETDELIYLIDNKYSVSEECNGCGICAKVCPASNIIITEGKPEWLHRCENCLACYNWCPKKAVRGTVAAEGHYYRHPEVKASDMIRQSIKAT